MDHFNSCVSSGLELTIAMPGFFSSGEDINQIVEEEEEEEEESPKGGAAPRKKLRLTKDQSRLLEQSFTQNHTLNPREKETLAKMLCLKPRQIEVWFQNRRARSKLKQTEMECEYLKRWFGSLSEQNRKLHKKVEELRAINHSPPPSSAALSMCPRCQRLTTTTSASSPN